MNHHKLINLGFWISIIAFTLCEAKVYGQELKSSFKRERIKLDEGWHFMRYENNPDNLIYDVRLK